MTEAKSIENTLIKISVRTAWYISAAVIAGSVLATLFYVDLRDGQKEVVNMIKLQNQSIDFQLQNVKKDITGITDRIVKLEPK